MASSSRYATFPFATQNATLMTKSSYTRTRDGLKKGGMVPIPPPPPEEEAEPGCFKKTWNQFARMIWPHPSFVFCHVCAEKDPQSGGVNHYKNARSEYCCNKCGHVYLLCEFKGKFDANGRKVTCGQLEYRVGTVWLVVAIFLYLLSAMMSNVGVAMMGYRMPPYAAWLLWFPQLILSIMLAICALLAGESFFVSWREQGQFLLLGAFSSINGILAQYAIPFVAPELTNLLMQSAIPLIWISSWIFFRWKMTTYRVLMFLLIMAGLLTGVVPSMIIGSGAGGAIATKPFWVVITLLGALPIAFLTTFQERAFKEYGSGMWVTNTYLNFYTFIAYVVTLPLTMTPYFGEGFTWDEMWENQLNAFYCFFGQGQDKGLGSLQNSTSPIPCQPEATTWVLVFTFGFFGTTAVGAALLKVKDSNLIANLTALGTPLTAIIFWIPWIVGDDAQDPASWIAISAVVICVADILYERYSDLAQLPDDFFARFMTKSKYGKWLTWSVLPKRCTPIEEEEVQPDYVPIEKNPDLLRDSVEESIYTTKDTWDDHENTSGRIQ